MLHSTITLSENKKIYFASDFHLGVPSASTSLEREKKVVRWLQKVSQDAQEIYLVGDIFDFWFEYKHTIPKGYIRFLGELARITDCGIQVHFFAGNHDMWMFDYFTDQMGIQVIRKPISLSINNLDIMVGHGDGLGPGDHKYKLLKRIFENRVCQWAFARLHPNFGIGLAKRWSKSSRVASSENEEVYLGEKEYLVQFCKSQEIVKHHDYYIFGHRHLPLDVEIGINSRYINLGEWVNNFTYAELDGKTIKLKKFED